MLSDGSVACSQVIGWLQEQLRNHPRMIQWGGEAQNLRSHTFWLQWDFHSLSDIKKHVISLILSYFKISYHSDIGFSCISHIWIRILLLAFRTTNLPLIDFSAYHFSCYLDNIIIGSLHFVIEWRLLLLRRRGREFPLVFRMNDGMMERLACYSAVISLKQWSAVGLWHFRSAGLWKNENELQQARLNGGLNKYLTMFFFWCKDADWCKADGTTHTLFKEQLADEFLQLKLNLLTGMWFVLLKG